MIFFPPAVHFIAEGMTNMASMEFNIGKVRMQLLWSSKQAHRR